MLKMFQDMKTSIKREIEDDESNDLDLKEEIPLKKPKNDEIQIKEEQVEYDDDSEGRLADKTCDNNGEESIQSNVSKKERGANKGTPKSSESSLQVENPLEELFWVQDGLYFEEQDPNSLSASNLPASTNDPTTSKGVSTSQQVTVNENSRKNAKNQRRDHQKKSTYDQDLLTYLENETDGKGILTIYKKNNILTPSARKSLVHLLVQREKDEVLKNAKAGEILPDWDIPSSRWIKLAQEVEDLFKSELKEVFFTPFRVENGTKMSASGKLVDRFYYVKRVMRDQGILASNMKRKKKVEPLTVEVLDKTMENDLNYLVNNSEPFYEVQKVFMKTRSIRRNISKFQNKNISEYLLSVKALRLNEPGQTLINLDFDNEYGDKNSILFDKWPKIRDYLMDVLRRDIKGVSLSDATYINLLKSMSYEQQDVMIFYLLHYITTSKKKKPKKNRTEEDLEVLRKVTSDEKRQSYLLHVEKIDDLNSSVEKLKDWLKERNLSFQPILVIVGPLLNIQSFYVIVDDIKYSTESLLEAIDLNFKIFYVFDREYPVYVDDLWKFIQSVLYEIPAYGEKMPMQHKLLNGQIQRLCKKC